MIHGASRPAAQAGRPGGEQRVVGAAGQDRVEDHEVQREQQREDVVRDRAEHLGEPDDRAVQPRPPSSGAVDPGADADREEHDHGAEGQRERGGEPGEDLALDLTVGAERVAQAGRRARLDEAAVDDRAPDEHALEVLGELLGDRPVQLHAVPDVGQSLGRAALVTAHRPRRVRGPDEEEHERRDHGHQDDAGGHGGATGDVESHAGIPHGWGGAGGGGHGLRPVPPTGGTAGYWSTQMFSRNGMPWFGSSTTPCTLVPKTKLPLSQ